MNAELIVVGKTADARIAACAEDYAARVRRYMNFDVTVVPGPKNTKSMPEGVQKDAEGEAILKTVRPGDWLVLLDERGPERTSRETAAWLESKRRSVKRLVFVIGGPYGFSRAVYDRADETLSLSKMTFSHQMVRLVFAEQLYRACTILKGEPYHHE